MNPILYYVHDPMCSWCWGFSRALTELYEQLPATIKVQRVLGGLAPDTDLPMPESMQEQIKSNWTRIEETIQGVKFNFDFWINSIPRRSTYPACRAVIAARRQGDKYDVLMTKKIQEAYYQQAANPSNDSTLIDLANELKLSISDFKNDLNSDETVNKLREEIMFARGIYVESFPSLVLKIDNEIYPIEIDYTNSLNMLNAIQQLLIKHTD